MEKVETSKRFIKLTIAEENEDGSGLTRASLYILPEDIRALVWDPEHSRTKITTAHGDRFFQDTVEEAPGVIFDKCDKAASQYNPNRNE